MNTFDQKGACMYLELQDIKKSYGSGDIRTLVLKGISLSLEKGTICVLLGPSGSGKSTLLNIIGGIDSADSGTITIDGQSVGKMNEKQLTSYRRRNLGYIFQSYNLIPNLSCKENILLPTLYNRRNQVQDFDELTELLDLGPLLSQRVNTLSGGEKQRVAIARALILDPCLILADEPTGNLDPKNRDLIMNLLRREHEKGRGVILITHDMEIAKEADSILLLEGGKLHQNNA
jgi:putative ABC transport system ATP-binding protein